MELKAKAEFLCSSEAFSDVLTVFKGGVTLEITNNWMKRKKCKKLLMSCMTDLQKDVAGTFRKL